MENGRRFTELSCYFFLEIDSITIFLLLPMSPGAAGDHLLQLHHLGALSSRCHAEGHRCHRLGYEVHPWHHCCRISERSRQYICGAGQLSLSIPSWIIYHSLKGKISVNSPFVSGKVLATTCECHGFPVDGI